MLTKDVHAPETNVISRLEIRCTFDLPWREVATVDLNERFMYPMSFQVPNVSSGL